MASAAPSKRQKAYVLVMVKSVGEMKDFSGLGTLLTLHSRRALFLTL